VLAAESWQQMADERTLIAFDAAPQDINWEVFTDEVTGAGSANEFHVNGSGFAKFSGDVPQAIEGGYVACRCTGREFDLSDSDALRIRIRGDGKTYGVTLRSNGTDGLCYTTDVMTRAGEWQEYTLPFSSFIPRSRGHYVNNALPLSPNAITSVGFFIDHKQEGHFRLDVDWIKAARTAYPLDAHRWKNRLLLIFAPSRLSRQFLEQIGELAEYELGLRERDVVVVDAFEDGEGRDGGRALPREQVRMLREFFAIDRGEFAVILLDKNGGEKLRANGPLAGADLMTWIDEIPA
jgi:hypothetical protein